MVINEDVFSEVRFVTKILFNQEPWRWSSSSPISSVDGNTGAGGFGNFSELRIAESELEPSPNCCYLDSEPGHQQ